MRHVIPRNISLQQFTACFFCANGAPLHALLALFVPYSNFPQCEEEDATRFCEQCGDKFCANCFNKEHATGIRMKHTWSRMGKIECAECEKQDATKWCVVCDDPFCNTCWEDLHRRGNRARHPFCPIKSEDGSIDMSAVGPDGKLLGTSYDVGPQKRGGGEDGDGTVPDEFKESESHVETSSPPADGYGPEVDQAVWAEYADAEVCCRILPVHACN